MKNIFNILIIPYYFNNNMNSDLSDYLYNNLQDENFILSLNLNLQLKNNLNE